MNDGDAGYCSSGFGIFVIVMFEFYQVTGFVSFEALWFLFETGYKFLLFETLLLYDGYCICCLDESLAGFFGYLMAY